MRRLAGIVFLLLQLGSVVHARFVPSRWLAWAPNDYAVWYRLQVRIKERLLSADEIGQRYRLPTERVYENPAQNIMDIVRQCEQTYGRDDRAQVVLFYRPNGGATRQWRWPER